MSKDTALAPASAPEFQLAPIDAEMATAIKEELDGLGQIPFDSIKIPAGGGITFEIPGDDPDRPETASSIVGVIVYHHAVNAYWPGEYRGGNEPPECASFDGRQGIDRESGELMPCASCPHNQFGSGKNGGKACKNGHRVYILRSGEMLPLLLTVPPTSLKALSAYLSRSIVLKGTRCWKVITELTLKKEKNAGGIAYSSCVFKRVGTVPPEQVEATKAMADFVRSVSTAVPIVEDTSPLNESALDIQPGADDGFAPVPDAPGDVPF